MAEILPLLEDLAEFHVWLNTLRVQWQKFRADHAQGMTFAEYLLARQTYQMEIDNG